MYLFNLSASVKKQKLPYTIVCACRCIIDTYEKLVLQWIRTFLFHSLVLFKQF